MIIAEYIPYEHIVSYRFIKQHLALRCRLSFVRLYVGGRVCYTRFHMKHDTPQPQYTRCADLEALLTEAVAEENDLEFVLFENLALPEGAYPGLTFRNCRFVGCRISGSALERAAFIDCVLEHCDCSNVNLQKATLERTRLVDCKLVGATLSEAFLLDVAFDSCIAR